MTCIIPPLIHFAAIGLQYVDPAVRYPPGWFYDGVTPTDIRTSNATIRETWEAMEHLVDIGLARSIGISNFNCVAILDLLRYARIRPTTLQIEHHPYLVQKPFIDFAKKEGITVTAYSSFGPQGYVEMDLEHAVKTPDLFQHQVINEIAKKHGKSPPQVLLRWATQQGIAVIPKSDTLPMLLENLDAKGFNLTEEEILRIDGLDQNLRFNDPWVVSRTPSSGGDLLIVISTLDVSQSSIEAFDLFAMEAFLFKRPLPCAFNSSCGRKSNLFKVEL
jgi:D-xylose reductase